MPDYSNAFRRTEEHLPWDPRCQWNKLRQQCLDFKASLPRQHALTPQNIQAHISLKTSTPYTLMHTVYLLCQIMLHREYVPFVPIRCSRPEGPLDPPMFPANEYDVPPGFWDDSARECFKAAREIMDLVASCQEWNALVETPIVGFAIYTVAFVGVYCINFPWMDPHGYMCSQPCASVVGPDGSTAGESEGFQAARKALEIIGDLRQRLHMANGWFNTISKMHRHFMRLKKDYEKNMSAMDSNASNEGSQLSSRHMSLRESGDGGGLDEWNLLEQTLTHFSSLGDSDIEMTDAGLRSGARAANDVLYDDSSIGTPVKSEERDHPATSVEQQKGEGGPWNAINAGPGAPPSPRPSLQTPSSAQFRSYDSYSNHSHGSLPPPQLPPTQPPPKYAQQLNTFRPNYGADTPGPGAPPSLTSPASYSASTPSQASPPFDRQPSAGYNGWMPQTTSYPAPSPLQPPYANGAPHQTNHPQQQHLPQLAPMQAASAYSTPNPPQLPSMHQQQLPPLTAHHQQQPQPQPQHLQPASQLQEPQQQVVWDSHQKEQWLNSLHTRMSADDLAAFVDGGDIGDWTSRSGQGQGGWLTTLWRGPAGRC